MGHVGQTDKHNRADVQGSRPKRKGARTVQNGFVKVILLGGGEADCLHGRGGKREILGIERWQTQATGAGQGALSDSVPNWRGTALQYPTNAKKVKAQKKKHTGVGVGDSKKTTHTPLDAEFPPIMYLAFHSFQRTPYHWTKTISSHGFCNLAKKTCGHSTVLRTQYPARVTTSSNSIENTAGILCNSRNVV